MSQDFWILTFTDLYVLLCFVLRKESANKRYRNTVNNLISPNTVSQNDEQLHTAELDDTAIDLVTVFDAILCKLLDIRFSYKHWYFSRVCLLVKMALKTVTRSIPHVKTKLPKYRMKKSPIPQYRKPWCPPLLYGISENRREDYICSEGKQNVKNTCTESQIKNFR